MIFVALPPFMRVEPVIGSGPTTGVSRMLFASDALANASATSGHSIWSASSQNTLGWSVRTPAGLVPPIHGHVASQFRRVEPHEDSCHAVMHHMWCPLPHTHSSLSPRKQLREARRARYAPVCGHAVLNLPENIRRRDTTGDTHQHGSCAAFDNSFELTHAQVRVVLQVGAHTVSKPAHQHCLPIPHAAYLGQLV